MSHSTGPPPPRHHCCCRLSGGDSGLIFGGENHDLVLMVDKNYNVCIVRVLSTMVVDVDVLQMYVVDHVGTIYILTKSRYCVVVDGMTLCVTLISP